MDERTGRLVAGHGRLAVLHQMKKDGDSPPARIVEKAGEWMVPIVRGVGFDSDADAEAYLIADNRLTELGGWDDAVLLEVLQDLAKNDALDGSGYDGDDIDALIAQLETELQGGNTDPDEVPGAPDDASWIWGSITSSLVRIITKSSRI